MKLNKVVHTKKSEVLIVVAFDEQEFEDLLSMSTLAASQAEKVHRNSPKFGKSIQRIQFKLKRTWKDYLNREKQREALKLDDEMKNESK